MMRRFADGRRARVLIWLAAVVLAALALCYAAGVLASSYVLAAAVLAGVLLSLFGMYTRMQRREEHHLRRHARHDSLTGLPNRSLFVERVDRALDRTGEDSVAVLFVDLDDFKEINHSYGYAAGDELLAAVARRLEKSVGPEGTIARLGGDEFTVLLGDASSVSSAVAAARRISRALEDPFGLEEGEVLLSASIGIAVSEGAVRGTPESMLREADVAMHGAKKKGKSRYRVFDAGAESTTGGRLVQEAELRRAIKERELRVYYQPLVSLATGDILGVEALVRWQHPLYGLILPAEFVPLAEQTGLIAPVGRWVLREACRQVRLWQREHPADPPLTLSVNISACQFQQPNLVREVGAVLKETGLAPHDLKLEITESVVMHDASAVTALRTLKDMGVGIAMDDFGTGYSSLSYLKRFPIDTLKIDRSYVHGLGTDAEDTAIVHATVAFARSLDMSVTAEGIENAEQLGLLKGLGCELGQGYHFAKPLPSDGTIALLASGPLPARSNEGLDQT